MIAQNHNRAERTSKSKRQAACLGAVSLAAFVAVCMAASAATPGSHHAAKSLEPQQVHAAFWPDSKSPFALDRATEGKVDALLATMTVEEKIGQVIQPEWKTITPAEVISYHIGSIENGGGAVPGGNKHATVQDWVNLIDPYWQASVDAKNHVRIPLV
jgi:beta-glucosidase